MIDEELEAVAAMARHLCERLPISPNEKNYADRLWVTYLRITNRPGVIVAEEEAFRKRFDATVKTYLMENK